MPPKIKISKQDIINAGVDLMRKNGETALNARALASHIGCSTQPIFSNYESMESLKQDVIVAAYKLYQNYVIAETNTNHYPPYKASGMAYIRFAKEESELFKLLFMRNRSHEQTDTLDPVTESVLGHLQKDVGFTPEQAMRFHLEMWIYTHGIATMLATSFLPLDLETISSLITDAYLGLKKHYHIVCRECGHVADVEVEFDDELLSAKTIGMEGFTVEACNLEFRGLCSDCLKKSKNN